MNFMKSKKQIPWGFLFTVFGVSLFIIILGQNDGNYYGTVIEKISENNLSREEKLMAEKFSADYYLTMMKTQTGRDTVVRALNQTALEIVPKQGVSLIITNERFEIVSFK